MTCAGENRAIKAQGGRRPYPILAHLRTTFTPTYRSAFSVGSVSVGIDGECDADVNLVPPLESFRVEAEVPDIHIRIEWVDSLASASGNRRLFDSGSIWRLNEDETGFEFDFNAPFFGERPYKRLHVDACFRWATLQMSRKSLAQCPYAAEPLEYPLDELLIMHRLTQERAIELHGCGIVGPYGSNLFVGHSGAGKSTTTRLWTAHHDVQVLSDDRIIVREHRVRDGNVCEDDLCEDIMRRESSTSQIFMYGTPWHGEACFALPDSAPLQRIFILEHGCGNVITRLSRSQTVAELFARSFVPFHRHEYVESALSFLERVADSVPCYRYAFEPDERAVDRILNFHD
jgi:hypothetical protein